MMTVCVPLVYLGTWILMLCYDAPFIHSICWTDGILVRIVLQLMVIWLYDFSDVLVIDG